MPEPRHHLLRNQTPCELVLLGDLLSIRLAPLENRQVRDDPVRLFGDAARFARLDRAASWEPETLPDRRLRVTVWAAFQGFTGLTIGGIGYAIEGSVWWLAAGATWLLIHLAAVYRLARNPGPRETFADSGPGSGAQGTTNAPDYWDLLPHPGQSRGLAPWRDDMAIASIQGMVAAAVLLVAVAAPALAIYYGTELSQVIRPVHWDHWRLTQGSTYQFIVVARCLQLALVILLSLLPGLMFYQFDKERLTTLIDRWLHAIFRLDPTLHTVADVDAKYGRRVEEFFGAPLTARVEGSRRRLRNRTPVVAITLLIAIGWILVLVDSRRTLAHSLPSLQDLFEPVPAPMTMAFLGGYFLTIQVTLRGYIRGDLKPKTYNVLCVRILMAVILAWTLQALGGTTRTTLALSFLAGITPNTVLRRIRDVTVFDWVRRRAPRAFAYPQGQGEADLIAQELEDRTPLTLIDEIDVYERTRLEEEGITCVQALARHDFIDLMLSSRIPIPRLVDWMDQAILFQHLPKAAVGQLRALTIRNASDFLRALRTLEDYEAGGKPIPVQWVRAAAALGATVGPMTPTMLRDELKQDEWLQYVLNWRSHDGLLGPDLLVYDPQGEATLHKAVSDSPWPSMRELQRVYPATPREVRLPADQPPQQSRRDIDLLP